MGITIVWGFGVILGVVLLFIYVLFYRKSERIAFINLLILYIILLIPVIIVFIIDAQRISANLPY